MLEHDPSRPLYQQLADTLLSQITSGQIAPGDELPSARELERIHGVSGITVRRALSTLRSQGYLYSVPRRGTYAVSAPPPPPAGALRSFSAYSRRRGMQPSSIVLQAAVIPAELRVAERLVVAPGDPVVRLERVRLADGIPFCLQTAHLPHALCPGILSHDFATESLYTVLEQDYGFVIGRQTLRIRANLAGPREAALLDLPPTSCILHVESRNSLASGQVFEFVVIEYRADCYEMTIGE